MGSTIVSSGLGGYLFYELRESQKQRMYYEAVALSAETSLWFNFFMLEKVKEDTGIDAMAYELSKENVATIGTTAPFVQCLQWTRESKLDSRMVQQRRMLDYQNKFEQMQCTHEAERVIKSS